MLENKDGRRVASLEQIYTEISGHKKRTWKV